MIKFKRLAFITVMVVATLLAIGNLTTPAQANSSDDIFTPTPTGTPIIDPNAQGEPVSLKQQEELKAVIQSYFEIRYSALSISQPYGFRPDGFGDLVSAESDARAFLDAELGKLALEIKYAELNRSRYVDYKYFLDFSNFSMDAATQLVTVSVVEDNEIIYEISAENDPTNPLVAQMSGLKHTIVLRKEQDQWKIVSDDYNDFLWRTVRQNGKSTEEMLNRLNTMEAPAVIGPSSESAGTETASLLPDDASSHAYDRAAAVFYAQQHAALTNYNKDYPSYDDGNHGDCTNFVSQALYEGGNVSMYIPPGPLPPKDLNIAYSGWYLLSSVQRATDWNDVNGFYTFVTNYGFPSEGPEGYEFPTVPEGQFPAGLMLGDVIQYNEENDATWEHAAIVIGFDSAGDPLVASHSPNNPQIHFMNVVAHMKTRFIHIERSDGNPPVKAEITQGSDDAGIYTILPSTCAFSVSANEVYFGACFGSGASITSGFRFNNIQIPKNAQVKYAVMTMSGDGDYTVPLNLQIYGEDSGNSATFSAGSPPANRSTPYTPEPWNVTGNLVDKWVSGVTQNTPQFSSVIQNIINHPNWAHGNSLSVIIKNAGSNTRRVMAYERAIIFPVDLSPARLIAAYDVTTTPLTYNSVGSQDGWILESNESSDVGGTFNSSATSFRLGDDNANKQYRSILHFNTSTLPDNAVIISVVLKIKQQGSITGTDPFTTHGSLLAAIQKPYFGSSGLAIGDFQATPARFDIATFDSIPSNGWYTALLRNDAFPHINLTGTTQFRLYFKIDDNNDVSADYMAFSSGNNGTTANRPQLIVNYYVP